MQIAVFVLAALVALFVAIALYARGGGTLRAQFLREVAALRAAAAGPADAIVTEQDLAPLPDPVQRYLRLTGAVGQPRVGEYRVRMRGRIRSGPAAAWMPLEAEQVSFAHPPARLFFLRASMMGVPVIGLHRYVGEHAIMDIRLAGLVPIVNAKGPDMDRAETVTLFNDMAILAPATLLSPAIEWGRATADTVEGVFRNAGQTVRARLVFDGTGELVDFVSDDRARTSDGGKSSVPERWNTPMRDYRAFGPHRLASRGAARWQSATGAWDYIELEMLSVEYGPPRDGG